MNPTLYRAFTAVIPYTAPVPSVLPRRMNQIPVKTSCIGVCSTGIGDSVCRGCKRFSHEVIDWNSYSDDQKRVIDRRLAGFLSQCVSNKLRVTGGSSRSSS